MATATDVRPESDVRAQAADGGFSIICLSRQDWASRLPTNRQQIMRRAAARGHEVVFVETGRFLGTRIARALRRPGRGGLRQLAGGQRVEERVLVRRALNILPWGQRFPLSAAVNRWVTALAIRRDLRRLPRPVVLWIYDPVAFGRAGGYGEDMAVYDVVDDYPEQAGAARRAFVTTADARAARESRLVFATTTPLRERHSRHNARTHLVRNVGDFAHFAPARDPGLTAPEVAGLGHPVLGFAGNLTSTKVDFALLEEIATRFPQATVLLVGPAEGADRARVLELAGLPNVEWVGLRSYEELPRFVAAFDVALIPYLENDYTRSCFPLKLFEYLAAGKPVVATGLPELEGMEPDVVLAADRGAAVEAIESALAGGSPADLDRRSTLAAANTWESRTERLLDFVSEELAGR